jgi:hypothetical protein
MIDGREMRKRTMDDSRWNARDCEIEHTAQRERERERERDANTTQGKMMTRCRGKNVLIFFN